jgi:hypothetical protein
MSTEKQVLASIPYIISRFSEAVEVTKIYVLCSFSTTYTFFQKKTEWYSAICLSFGIWIIQMQVATYMEHAMKSTVDHIDFELLSLTYKTSLGPKPTS